MNDRYVFWTGSSGCSETHGLNGVETRGMEIVGGWSIMGRRDVAVLELKGALLRGGVSSKIGFHLGQEGER